jgi:hypothetical protein
VVIRDCAFTGDITISGGSKVEIIDSTFSGNLTVTDAATNVFLSGCTINGEASFSKCNWQAHGTTFKKNLVANQCHSKLFRSTVQKAFSHNHSIRNSTKLDCVIFQSTIGRTSGDLLLSKANRTWVTYSTIHHAKQQGGTEAHFIGNQIYINKAQGNNGISLDGAACETTIANNHFFHGGTTNTGQVAINASQTSANSNSYVKKKTINLDYLLISSVRNEIRHQYNGVTARCNVKYIYSDGTEDTVNHYTSSSSWQAKAYTNPYPTKLVIKIEIYLYSYNGPYAYERSTRVLGNSNGVSVVNAKKVRLLNNLFRNWDSYGHCVSALMAPADGLFIRGNAFWRSSGTWQKHAVNAQQGFERYVFNTSGASVADPDVCAYNYFHNSSKKTTGGIAETNSITPSDPKFVNNSSNWNLQTTSPLKNKGPVDPEYKDHDGSRNDIGMFGGHIHDPNGTTSTVPVIISADQSAYRINKGGAPLLIKVRAAVSTP